MPNLWLPRSSIYHVHCPHCGLEFLDKLSTGDLLAKLREHTAEEHPETSQRRWENHQQ